MQLRFSNFTRARLAAPITAAATVLTVQPGTWPQLPEGYAIYGVLQSVTNSSQVEIIKVVASDGTTLTVERGQEGTLARAFSANDRLDQRLTAGQFNLLYQHSLDVNVHVPPGGDGKFLFGGDGGVPEWRLPNANQVGALALTGGKLTGTLEAPKIQGTRGAGYGGLELAGTCGYFNGIYIAEADCSFGSHYITKEFGVINANGTWRWSFNTAGLLTNGSVPYSRVVGQPVAADWVSKSASLVVAGKLGWAAKGNGSVVLDSSDGAAYGGVTVGKTDPANPWTVGCPTLMGFDGVSTYGVRVDCARFLGSPLVQGDSQNIVIRGKTALSGLATDDPSGNKLIINYLKGWGYVEIMGQLRPTHGGSTSYDNAQVQVNCDDGGDVRIAMHRPGLTAAAIRHDSWGLVFERESSSTFAKVAASNFFALSAQDTSANALVRYDFAFANFLKRRHRLRPDDGTSLDTVNNECGFNYGTGGAGVPGPYLSFGGLGGNYDCQMQAEYTEGRVLKFRVKNGGSWNPWYDIWHSGNFNPANKLDVAGGTLTGSVHNSATGFVNTYVGGRLNTESNMVSLDGYTYSFVTSPSDAHLCRNARWTPASGWVKYDNSTPSHKITARLGGLTHEVSDAGSTNPNQRVYPIWSGYNANNVVFSGSAQIGTVSVAGYGAGMYAINVQDPGNTTYDTTVLVMWDGTRWAEAYCSIGSVARVGILPSGALKAVTNSATIVTKVVRLFPL